MKKYALLLVLTTLGVGFSHAQDLKYTPKNPAFGGDTFNYNWMLSQAQAQNDFSENPNSNPFNRDPLLDFQNDLNRQILSQLSRSLVGDLFGEDGNLNEGTYEIGNYQIEIINGIDGVNIGIFDTGTGGKTSVTIPFF